MNQRQVCPIDKLPHYLSLAYEFSETGDPMYNCFCKPKVIKQLNSPLTSCVSGPSCEEAAVGLKGNQDT